MAKAIVNYVQLQMWSDESTTKDNVRIEENYKKADAATKAVIDDIFISLCGYSLETIIKDAPKV